MAVIGESPIWSYFKPKATSNHKRKKPERPGGESTKPREREVKASEKRGKEKATAIDKPIDCSQANPSMSHDSQVPKMQNVTSARKRKAGDLEGFFSSSHSQRYTGAPPSQRYKGAPPSPTCASASSSHDAKPNRKILRSSTTSSYDDSVTLNLSMNGQLKEPFDPVLEDTDSVPSSQTQCGLVCLAPNHSVCSNGSRTGINNPGLNSYASNFTKTRDPVDDDDGHLIIQSSQSQSPLCIPDDFDQHPSPTNITDTCKRVLEPFSECIPSSQSQEVELSVPQVPQECGGSRLDWRQSSSRLSGRLTHDTTNQHLKRALSDEIFPVSIYEPFTTDIFRGEDQHDTRSNPVIPDSYGEHDQDSDTESESEDDDNQLGNLPQGLSRNAGQLPERDTPPSQEAAYDASQEDATQGIDEASQSYIGDPSILQPPQESQEYSFQSLPPDLREVFGNSDDSFPPDFPMSLR